MTARPSAAGGRRRLGVAVAALALLAGGCSGPSAPAPDGGSPTSLPSLGSGSDALDDPAFAAFAGQSPAWGPCPEPAGADDDGVDCASLEVPVDWSAPGGDRIDVALARRSAPGGSREGVLVVDPGGPGASGVSWVRSGPVVTPAVAERYDVVGFDPRGSGASAPVECLDGPGLDAFLAGSDADGPVGPADDGATAADGSDESGDGPDAMARGCAERGGDLLAHVDVASVAKDLDVLRDALGQGHLDYLGKSWGTALGATYAGLFPQRVGRMVLDGALDPSLSAEEVALDQARGLEGALRSWVEDCPQRRACPLDVAGGDAPATAPELAQGLEQVSGFLDAVEQEPLATGSPRLLTEPLAVTAVIAPLYSRATWPDLDRALGDALAGDGAALLAAADAYVGRQPDGTYASNLIQAFTAVTCLDTDTAREPPLAGPGDAAEPPADETDTDADEPALAAISEVAPVLGAHLLADSATCEHWPVAGVRTPAEITAEGAAPILIVGTTGDPATPYPWAQSLASQLSRAALLTYRGEGHTAYGRGSACIDAAVERYLLEDELPGKGATCTR